MPQWHFDHEFEDLPTVTEGAFAAGEVNGKAEIEFYRDRSFQVLNIWLDGSRLRTREERAADPALTMFERRWIKIEIRERPELWCAIRDQIEKGRFKSSVENAIDQQFEWAAA